MKKVEFDIFVQVKYLEMTDEERQYRKDEWKNVVADRLRFEKRIRTANELIGPVLIRKHKIFRVMNYYIKNNQL